MEVSHVLVKSFFIVISFATLSYDNYLKVYHRLTCNKFLIALARVETIYQFIFLFAKTIMVSKTLQFVHFGICNLLCECCCVVLPFPRKNRKTSLAVFFQNLHLHFCNTLQTINFLFNSCYNIRTKECSWISYKHHYYFTMMIM